jgi:hypothetical protein
VTGAAVNVAYRSGTNLVHGGVWEFFRDTALNATGFFKPGGALSGWPGRRRPRTLRLGRWL